jgi:hypothetical protein
MTKKRTQKRHVNLSFPGGKKICLRDKDLKNIGLDPDLVDDGNFELIKRELQRVIVGKFHKLVKKAVKRALKGDYYSCEYEGD